MLTNLILTMLLIPSLLNVYSTDKLFFDTETNPPAAAPQRINIENIGVQVTALRYAAIDVDSGELLLQKSINEQQPLASITKLMTALVILDQKPDWNVTVEMSAADETEGAMPHIYRGEQLSFEDTWKAALITSDNNAIEAMIRTLGISDENFVALMNKKAEDLQMFNTKFVDPTGLSENNVSTALDLARLLRAAIKKYEIRSTVLQSKYVLHISNNKKARTINNTDILVDSFLNQKEYGYELIGGKTGFVPLAGYCLTTAIKKDGHEVIFVVLHSATIDDRFQDTKVIADWVFSNYKW